MNKFFTLVLFLLLAHSGKGQISVAVDGQKRTDAVTEEQLKVIFEKTQRFPSHTELAMALIKNGSTTFYGIERRNDSIMTKENRDAVFEIGSISKVFTATLFGNFVYNKKVSPDDLLQTHLNFPIKTEHKITLSQLANHTSGLPRLPSNLNLFFGDQQNPYKDYDEKKLNEYLAEKIVVSQNPGEKYVYSNLGVGLLGYILTKVEGVSYHDLLKKYIFSKYRMTRSTTHRSEVKEDLIAGVDSQGNPVPNWDSNILVGAGGILSSVNDLSAFALAMFNPDNILQLTTIPTFSINENTSIGWGWHIIKTKSGGSAVWHNGGTGGYSSSMALDLPGKNGIIILSNISPLISRGEIDKLCFDLLEIVKD